jgi:hypothetical protein
MDEIFGNVGKIPSRPQMCFKSKNMKLDTNINLLFLETNNQVPYVSLKFICDMPL